MHLQINHYHWEQGASALVAALQSCAKNDLRYHISVYKSKVNSLKISVFSTIPSLLE
jgi:hypothetical protein